MLSTHRFKMLALATALTGLAACGGGRDDPLPTDSTSDPVAKYVGSWISTCVEDSGASAQARADLRKTSPTTMTGDIIAYAYIGRSCSGPSVRDKKVLSDLNVTFTGTTTTQGRTSDKFEGTSAQGEGKVLLFSDNTTMLVGDPDSPDDAQGFPTEFLEYSLTRLK